MEASDEERAASGIICAEEDISAPTYEIARWKFALPLVNNRRCGMECVMAITDPFKSYHHAPVPELRGRDPSESWREELRQREKLVRDGSLSAVSVLVELLGSDVDPRVRCDAAALLVELAGMRKR